jgi:DNA-binding HxlR family transcriptional regulator
MIKKSKDIAQLNGSCGELCPVIEAANLFGDSVVLLIIKELENGEKRYKELLLTLRGVSSSTLSKRLKLLEEKNIIIRSVIDSTPVKITYNLSQKGLDTSEIVNSLRNFGKKHLVE